VKEQGHVLDPSHSQHCACRFVDLLLEHDEIAKPLKVRADIVREDEGAETFHEDRTGGWWARGVCVVLGGFEIK
jgi:hypothetical protein